MNAELRDAILSSVMSVRLSKPSWYKQAVFVDAIPEVVQCKLFKVVDKFLGSARDTCEWLKMFKPKKPETSGESEALEAKEGMLPAAPKAKAKAKAMQGTGAPPAEDAEKTEAPQAEASGTKDGDKFGQLLSVRKHVE